MPSSRVLTQAVEKLSNATDLASITKAVAEAARQIAGSDGATFVLRDEDKCYYVDEHAISPLWKGKRFPLEACISGWSMLHRDVVTIRDIYADERIPHDAYRPTFVKSLCMVPIRSEEPIGAIGTYWAKDHQPGPEEVKLLQILANSSATALQNLELRQALMRRNAEREDLTARQKELEFQLHSLAHDLKNPLATMMGFAELLQMKARSSLDAKGQQYIESILSTGARLSQQIDRMLALYQLSNRSVEKQPVNLSALVSDIAEGLKAQDPSRRCEIDVEPGIVVSADPNLIRLALENLLSNSFKYSRKKDRTCIHFGRATGVEGAMFRLDDKGAGFDNAQAGKLFQPMVRLHSESEFSGTGLGLASVARIFEVHGGRVWAEGRPGEGATIFFSLP